MASHIAAHLSSIAEELRMTWGEIGQQQLGKLANAEGEEAMYFLRAIELPVKVTGDTLLGQGIQEGSFVRCTIVTDADPDERDVDIPFVMLPYHLQEELNIAYGELELKITSLVIH